MCKNVCCLLFLLCGIYLGETNVGSVVVNFLLVHRFPKLFDLGTHLCFEYTVETGRSRKIIQYNKANERYFYIENFCLRYSVLHMISDLLLSCLCVTNFRGKKHSSVPISHQLVFKLRGQA
jgi:hypothetical protein